MRKLVLLVSLFFLLSFLSQCTTLLLRDYQKNTKIYGFYYYYFYEVFKDTSGKPGTTIVESPNDWFDSNKIFHYCANNSLSSLETNLDKDYSYEIQRRKKDETCKKLYNSIKSNVTIEANGSLLLFDLGTRVYLPGHDRNSPISPLDLVIYKGSPLRKSIRDIKAAWISKGSICLEDSSKKIVSLDCSNTEGKGGFERRVCIQTSADCSNKTYPLYLSSIPRFAPTYFLKESRYVGSVSIAAWFPEHISNQSQIVEIEIGKFSEQMIISKTIPYVMSYGLYPVTIVLDVITFPFQIAAIFLFLKDFNLTGYVPPGGK